MSTPILPCLSHDSIRIIPSPPPAHPLQSPKFANPQDIHQHLATASAHLHASRTVAFPTETVYGLGASTLDSIAVKRVYSIKGRPADNPLIIHVSSLDMLQTLLPPTSQYQISKLYMALISAFWPGPLTLLFPSPNPLPPPAPQTNAIRMPAHPLALALIHHSNLPLSAPSANSSGRPSPTRAEHVHHDLNGAEGLGCILDGGDCGVGVESTVVNGLGWQEGGGGYVDILRPGGLGVEEVARIICEVDGAVGLTDIRLHGKSWRPNAVASSSKNPNPALGQDHSHARSPVTVSAREVENASSNVHMAPSTPGLKYRHYSPRIPVYLLLPSDIFPRPSFALTDTEHDITSVLRRIAKATQKNGSTPRLGLLHYDNSQIQSRLLQSDIKKSLEGITTLLPVSLGPDSTSAAQRLFSSILALEAKAEGVDAIVIEGCGDDGLGLAVMERAGKAVGGGGASGDLGIGEGPGDRGRFWVQL